MAAYQGVRELQLNDEDLAKLYGNELEGLNFYTNEYVMIKNISGENIDQKRWDGEKLVALKWRPLSNDYFGKVKPLNISQRFLFDLLQNDSIIGKVSIGSFGVGKSYVNLCWALDSITGRNSKFERLCWLRNNIEVSNTMPLGYLPSDLNCKLLPWAMPMVDILGDQDIFDQYITQKKIVLEHMGFLRSRTFENSIVYINEAQNCTANHLALVISRIGKGSCLIIEGDTRQTDKEVFYKQSGMLKMAEKFKGNPMFGMVKLIENVRSQFATLADLLLED